MVRVFKQITGAHGRSGKIPPKRDPRGVTSGSEGVNVTKGAVQRGGDFPAFAWLTIV